MKKIIVACVVIVVLAVIGFVVKEQFMKPASVDSLKDVKETVEKTTATAVEEKKTALPEVLHLLPEQADAVIKLGSVRNFYKYFSVTENSVFGQPVSKIEEVKAAVGFNPLVIKELETAGVDADKDFGLIINDLKQKEPSKNAQCDIFLFLPVNDAQKVRSSIVELLKKDTPTLTASDVADGITMISEPDKPERAYILDKKGYLFFGMNPVADSRPFADAILSDQNRLHELKSFEKVVSALDPNKDFFCYADVKSLLSDTLETIKAEMKKAAQPGAPDMTKSLEYMKDIEGSGISGDFSGSDLVMNAVANIAPGSPYSEILQNISFDKKLVLSIPDNPLLLMTYGVNMPAYYNMILDAMPEEDRAMFKQQLQMVGAQYGVDIEKDIIGNIAGNLGMGLYDGMSINMMNYNMLMTLTLKDVDLFRQTMDKFMANPQIQQMITKTTVGNEEAWMVSLMGMSQLFIALKDGNLVLSLGKPMLEKALAGSPSAGFVSKIQDKNLADTISGDNNLTYLDFGEVLKAVNNFAPMMAQMSPGKPVYPIVEKALGRFDYILSSNIFSENTVHMDLLFKTEFDQSFFQGVSELVAELKDAGSKPGESDSPR